MGDKHVFSFYRGDGEAEATLSYRLLDERAKAIAAELQALAPPEERAILLFPPGLDFIAAFFGCLYAGIVAVPAAIPSRNRLTASLEAIFETSKPSLVLSTADHCKHAKRTYAPRSGLAELPWIAVDQVSLERQHAWHELQVEGEQVAFLQYTSGSTSLPKGVMLSHDRLLHNASLIQEAFHTTTESHAVFWLPLYHDMGLIGGVIQPVYCGGSSTLMAPATFLQRPALWLETISRTRATVSGGPDFAYDLCARKIPAEERAELDLSHWELAFLGAERIRPQTIEQFVNAFAGCGFRREALFPCYGLAEATLMVSGGPRQTAPGDPPCQGRFTRPQACRDRLRRGGHLPHSGGVRREPVRAAALDRRSRDPPRRRGRECRRNLGPRPQRGLRLLRKSASDRGHLSCLSGRGTWRRYQGNRATWGCGSRRRPFPADRRSGVRPPEAALCDRAAENLIIIRGRNHYPEDIEQTISSTYEGLRVGCCAAFSIEVEDRDQLVVVQEVEPRKRDLDADAAIAAIRSAIAIRHELEVYAVVLVKAGSVPKTSSGKTRRAACREQYLRGELEIVAAWKTAADEAETELAEAPAVLTPRQAAAEEIESWLIERITARLRLCAGRRQGDNAVPGAWHGLPGRDGYCRRPGTLAGKAAISHRGLQLSHDRRLGPLAGQSREG